MQTVKLGRHKHISYLTRRKKTTHIKTSTSPAFRRENGGRELTVWWEVREKLLTSAASRAHHRTRRITLTPMAARHRLCLWTFHWVVFVSGWNGHAETLNAPSCGSVRTVNRALGQSHGPSVSALTISLPRRQL